MTGKTHSVTGIFAGLALSSYMGCSGTMTLALAVGSVLGSLLPDIDNVHSKIGSAMPVAEFMVHSCQGAIRALSCVFPREMKENIRSMVGHRGILHSAVIPAAMLLSLVFTGSAAGIEYFFLCGMIIGDISHMFLDLFSGGIPLLMPVSVRRIRLGSFQTGGIVDRLWRIVMYFGIGYLGLLDLYRMASEYIRI